MTSRQETYGERGSGNAEPTGGGLAPAVRPVVGQRRESDGVSEPRPAVRRLSPEEVIRRSVLWDVRRSFATHDGPFDRPDSEFVADSWFDFSYLDGYHEVERYWVNRPFAYVTVLYDSRSKAYSYHVVEPALDAFEEYVQSDLVSLLRGSLIHFDPGVEDREEAFLSRAVALVRKHAATVDPGTLGKVLYYLKREFLGYGPVDGVMRDPAIEDVSCDGIDVPVYVYHREYRDLRTNVAFDKSALTSFAVRLAQKAGKSLSVSEPLSDASLPDGSRVQLTFGGDVAPAGSNFTIRKFADIPYTPVDLVNWNTFSVEQMAYFWLAIENNKSLVFAGGTGSGKTTSMNAISFFIPPASKVVTIEDTREIDLPHENWVKSVTRAPAGGERRGEITTYDLLQAALRQRPEYLLVGEIRTEQRVALTFFQAMGTGHTAYTTMHADSVETALSRLQNPPLSVPAGMLADLDIVSIQRQTYIGDRRVRRNDVVAELVRDPENPNEVDVHEVFRWDPETDRHERVGESLVLERIASERGWSADELATELATRERLLRYLLDHDVTVYAEVAAAIQTYTKDPGYVRRALDGGRLDTGALAGTTADSERVESHDDRETWRQVVADARGD